MAKAGVYLGVASAGGMIRRFAGHAEDRMKPCAAAGLVDSVRFSAPPIGLRDDGRADARLSPSGL